MTPAGLSRHWRIIRFRYSIRAENAAELVKLNQRLGY